MRTSALLMTGALLVPLAAQALPVISPAPAAASESAPGANSAAQLAEARARLAAAIEARDAILAEIKASGTSLADIQGAAQAYARANAQAEAAQRAYDAAVQQASGFDSAKKGYDDAAAAIPQLEKNAQSTKATRDAAQAAYDQAIAPNPEAAKEAQQKVDAARARIEESKAAAKSSWIGALSGSTKLETLRNPWKFSAPIRSTRGSPLLPIPIRGLRMMQPASSR